MYSNAYVNDSIAIINAKENPIAINNNVTTSNLRNDKPIKFMKFNKIIF
jgi:hypothetical protein